MCTTSMVLASCFVFLRDGSVVPLLTWWYSFRCVLCVNGTASPTCVPVVLRRSGECALDMSTVLTYASPLHVDAEDHSLSLALRLRPMCFSVRRPPCRVSLRLRRSHTLFLFSTCPCHSDTFFGAFGALEHTCKKITRLQPPVRDPEVKVFHSLFSDMFGGFALRLSNVLFVSWTVMSASLKKVSGLTPSMVRKVKIATRSVPAAKAEQPKAGAEGQSSA